MRKILYFITINLISLLQLSAATIAIIDSGTDIKHQQLADQLWKNPVEIADNQRDEDKNGYPDDVFGWNFAENNNLVIDYKYLYLLNDDIRKFFEIQAKSFTGSITPQEIAWVKKMIKDQLFIKRISAYGNFMHGTHVAGIAALDNPSAKILSIKLLPTSVEETIKKLQDNNNENKNLIFRQLLKLIATQQMALMEEIWAFVDFHKAVVANGSFGTGYPQAKMIIETIYQKILKKEADPEKVKELANYFLNQLITQGQQIMAVAPKTLFVFAAGNDGLNNDKFPCSPANIKADNLISVAASLSRSALAPFSNFGRGHVDIAAPGVAIMSSVPGDDYLELSGTSQAAPYVSKVAAMIKDNNNKLTANEIKKILMATVDKKDYLAQAVKSSGIVNKERAITASKYSVSMSIIEAIKISREEIDDIQENNNNLINNLFTNDNILPLPLTRNIVW